MRLGSRRVRLRAVWLLLLPYLYFARPTPLLLVAGAAVALAGAGLRAWAAGCIHKDAELAVDGPYGHTRNPLYLGSLLIGTGVAVAGGRWIFVALFLAFFLLVYLRAMRHEERVLEDRFGERYRRYRRAVPLLLPRLSPYGGAGPCFSLRRYLRNREWEAALGLGGGFAFLLAKLVMAG